VPGAGRTGLVSIAAPAREPRNGLHWDGIMVTNVGRAPKVSFLEGREEAAAGLLRPPRTALGDG
jgi:hypothetical protein